VGDKKKGYVKEGIVFKPLKANFLRERRIWLEQASKAKKLRGSTGKRREAAGNKP